MNIQDRIVKVIIVITEAGQGLTREQLQNILVGKSTAELQELELDQLESFGIAENNDEDDWNAIIDKAIEKGLLKIKNQKAHTLTYTPEGKKYRKKPYSIIMDGEDGEQEVSEYQPQGFDDDDIDTMMRAIGTRSTDPTANIKSERSKRQIKLIKAIDRKIALDDFAESENIDLDEVLDDLENLLLHGKHMDITYFTDEVIGREDVEEVRKSLNGGIFDMNLMEEEWGDVYNEEELRLLRYILS
jgi:ATP-dependent DNA helicase RecQ